METDREDSGNLGMLDLFREELAERLRVLESVLVEIEQGLPAERMDIILHAVHAIRGACRVVGLPVAVSLAYAMEEFFSGFRQAKRCPLPKDVAPLLRQAAEIFRAIQNQGKEDIAPWVKGHEASIRRVAQTLGEFLAEMEDTPFAECSDVAIPASKTPEASPEITERSNIFGSEASTEKSERQAPGEDSLDQDDPCAVSTILNCLLVRIGGESYALPMVEIARVAKISPENLHLAGGLPCAAIGGETMVLLDAGQIFNLSSFYPPAGSLPVIFLERGERHCGLLVEAFLGEQTLVLQPLDERLGKVDYLRAAAILADGTTTLVLDTDDLLRAIDFAVRAGRLSKVASPAMTDLFTERSGLSGEDIPRPFWRW